MRLYRLALVLLVISSLVGSTGQGAEIVVEKDLTYATADGVELKLDLFRPAGDGPYPAIVFIHGGAWYQGNRQVYLKSCEQAAQRGYVAATISYRLMKFDPAKKESTTAKANFPAQIHDAKAAIRWLRANAAQYKIDKQRVGVTGGSAGGHLSLLVGLTDSDAGLEGAGGHLDQSSRVQAVVNVFGPTEMATEYAGSSLPWVMRLFLGGTPDEAPEQYALASPTTHVSQDDPPVLTIHGDRDALVPLQQAQLLDEKLKAAGVSHTLLIMKGQGHGFRGEHQQRAEQATWDFFAQHLKP